MKHATISFRFDNLRALVCFFLISLGKGAAQVCGGNNSGLALASQVLIVNENSNTVVSNYTNFILNSNATKSLNCAVQPLNTTAANSLFSVLPKIDLKGNLSFVLSPFKFGDASFNVTFSYVGSPAVVGWQFLTIFIQNVNQAPRFDVLPSFELWQGIENITIEAIQNISAGTNEDYVQQLSFDIFIVQEPVNLFRQNPVLSFNGSGGFLTCRLNPDVFGVAKIRLIAHDNGGDERGGISTSTPKWFNITVFPPNSPPTFTISNDHLTVLQGTDITSSYFISNITSGAGGIQCSLDARFCVEQVPTFVLDDLDRADLFRDLPEISSGGTLTFSSLPWVTGTANVVFHAEYMGAQPSQGVLGLINVSYGRIMSSQANFSIVVTEGVNSYSLSVGLARNVSCTTLQVIDECTCAQPIASPSVCKTLSNNSLPGEVTVLGSLDGDRSFSIASFIAGISAASPYLPQTDSLFTREASGKAHFQDEEVDPQTSAYGMEYVVQAVESPDGRFVYGVDFETSSILVFAQNQSSSNSSTFLDRLVGGEQRLRFSGISGNLNDTSPFDNSPYPVVTDTVNDWQFWDGVDNLTLALLASGTAPLSTASDPVYLVSPAASVDFAFDVTLWEHTMALWLFDLDSVNSPVGLSKDVVQERFRSLDVLTASVVMHSATMLNFSCSQSGCEVDRPTTSNDIYPVKASDQCVEQYPTSIRRATVADKTGRAGPLVLTGPWCKSRASELAAGLAGDWDVPPNAQLDASSFLMGNTRAEAMQFDGVLNAGLYLSTDLDMLVDGTANSRLPLNNMSLEIWFTVNVEANDYVGEVRNGLIGVEALGFDDQNPDPNLYCAKGWSLSYVYDPSLVTEASVTNIRFEFHLFTNALTKAMIMSTSTWNMSFTVPSMAQGEWHHIMAGYDGSNIYTYLDGKPPPCSQPHCEVKPACLSPPCGTILYPASYQFNADAENAALNQLHQSCTTQRYPFMVGSYINGMESFDARSISPHRGAISLLRIYNISLSAAEVQAQYALYAPSMQASGDIDAYYWGSRDNGSSSSPNIDFVDMAVPASLTLHGNFAYSRWYRCAWAGFNGFDAAVTDALVSADGQRLTCMTPPWTHGVEAALLSVMQAPYAAVPSWSYLWKKVCIYPDCGYVADPTQRGGWYFGDEVAYAAAAGGVKIALSNKASAEPTLFHFVARGAVLALDPHVDTSIPSGWPVGQVQVVSGGQNYVDGKLTILGESGRLFSGAFVTLNGVIKLTQILSPGSGYAGGGRVVPVYSDSLMPINNSIVSVALAAGGRNYVSGDFEVVDDAASPASYASGWFTVAPATGAVTNVTLLSHGAGYTSDPLPRNVLIYHPGTRMQQQGSITSITVNVSRSALTGTVNSTANATCVAAGCTGAGFEGTCIFAGGVLTAIRITIPGSNYNRSAPPSILCSGRTVPSTALSIKIATGAQFTAKRASGGQLSYTTEPGPMRQLELLGAPDAGRWNDPGLAPILQGTSSVVPGPAHPNRNFVMVVNRWNGQRVYLTHTSPLATAPQPSILYQCALAPGPPAAAQCGCAQVIMTAGVPAKWHYFKLQGGEYWAAGAYLERLPDDTFRPSAWSSIHRFNDALPGQTSVACNGKGGAGVDYLNVRDQSQFRASGVVDMVTFVMNDTTRRGQVLYMATANYDSLAATAGRSAPAGVYMLGRPVNANESIFSAETSSFWSQCTDTQALCSTDSDCLHTCSAACTVTLAAGVATKNCKCSNDPARSCTADADCNAGVRCGYGFRPAAAESHEACWTDPMVRYTGWDISQRVTICLIHQLDTPPARAVEYYNYAGRHYLIFAADAAAAVFAAYDGYPDFIPLPPVDCPGAASLQTFFSPAAGKDYLLCALSRGGSVRMLRWDGETFTGLSDPLTSPAADVGVGQAFPYGFPTAARHVVQGGAEYLLVGGRGSEYDTLFSTSGLFRGDYQGPLLDGPTGLALAPGTLYVSNLYSRSISGFQRDPPTGQLAYDPLLSFSAPASAAAGGMGNGTDFGLLRGLVGLAASADGRNVYALDSLDNAVHVLLRNVTTGRLSYLTSARDSDNPQMHMLAPTGLFITPSGGRLLVAAAGGQSVVSFRRNTADGSLTLQDSLWNGERDVGSMKVTLGASLPVAGSNNDLYPMQVGTNESWAQASGSSYPFIIKRRQYLAVVGDSRPAAAAPGGPAVVMAWNDALQRFQVVQELDGTYGAVDLVYFEITAAGGTRISYLAVATGAGYVYVYAYRDGPAAFVLHHIPTVPSLPYDSSGCSCLCAAGGGPQPAGVCGTCFRDGTVSSVCQGPSPRLNCSMQALRPVPARLHYTRDAASGQHFLAVANRDAAAGLVCQGRTYSLIYRWKDQSLRTLRPGDAPDAAARFEAFQALPTLQAADVDLAPAVHATLGNVTLASVCSFAGGGVWAGAVLRLAGGAFNPLLGSSTGYFEPLQTVNTTGCSAMRFIPAGGQTFLVVGNRQRGLYNPSDLTNYDKGGAAIIRWDGYVFLPLQNLSAPFKTLMETPTAGGGTSSTGVAVDGLRGVTDITWFTAADGETYLAMALSVCDSDTPAAQCPAETTPQPMSAILQFDPAAGRFTDMLSLTSGTARRLLGRVLSPQESPHHLAALRIPAGRAARWSPFTPPGGGGGQTYLAVSSLSRGLIVYSFRFTEVAGLAGPVALATDVSESFLYVASEFDHSLVSLALGPRTDIVGHVTSNFTYLSDAAEPVPAKSPPPPEAAGAAPTATLPPGVMHGVRSISVTRDADCGGYTANDTAMFPPGQACDVILVRRGEPRYAFPCGPYPLETAPGRPPRLPPARCLTMHLEVVQDSPSNPGLFAVPPRLLPEGSTAAALAFTAAAGQSGTAQLSFRAEGSLTGLPAPLSADGTFTIRVILPLRTPALAVPPLLILADPGGGPAGEFQGTFAVEASVDAARGVDAEWQCVYMEPFTADNLTSLNKYLDMVGNASVPEGQIPVITYPCVAPTYPPHNASAAGAPSGPARWLSTPPDLSFRRGATGEPEAVIAFTPRAGAGAAAGGTELPLCVRMLSSTEEGDVSGYVIASHTACVRVLLSPAANITAAAFPLPLSPNTPPDGGAILPMSAAAVPHLVVIPIPAAPPSLRRNYTAYLDIPWQCVYFPPPEPPPAGRANRSESVCARAGTSLDGTSSNLNPLSAVALSAVDLARNGSLQGALRANATPLVFFSAPVCARLYDGGGSVTGLPDNTGYSSVSPGVACLDIWANYYHRLPAFRPAVPSIQLYMRSLSAAGADTGEWVEYPGYFIPVSPAIAATAQHYTFAAASLQPLAGGAVVNGSAAFQGLEGRSIDSDGAVGMALMLQPYFEGLYTVHVEALLDGPAGPIRTDVFFDLSVTPVYAPPGLVPALPGAGGLQTQILSGGMSNMTVITGAVFRVIEYPDGPTWPDFAGVNLSVTSVSDLGFVFGGVTALPNGTLIVPLQGGRLGTFTVTVLVTNPTGPFLLRSPPQPPNSTIRVCQNATTGVATTSTTAASTLQPTTRTTPRPTTSTTPVRTTTTAAAARTSTAGQGGNGTTTITVITSTARFTTTVVAAGPHACQICTPGQVRVIDQCFPCPADFYCPWLDSDTPLPCPESATSPPGAAGIDQCECPSGQYPQTIVQDDGGGGLGQTGQTVVVVCQYWQIFAVTVQVVAPRLLLTLRVDAVIPVSDNDGASAARAGVAEVMGLSDLVPATGVSITVQCNESSAGLLAGPVQLYINGTLFYQARAGRRGCVVCWAQLDASAAEAAGGDGSAEGHYVLDPARLPFRIVVWPQPQVWGVLPALLPEGGTRVVTIFGRHFGSQASRGYSAARYDGVTALVAAAGDTPQPCDKSAYRGDGAALCLLPAALFGGGPLAFAVEVAAGGDVRRSAVLPAAAQTARLVLGGAYEDSDARCAAGAPAGEVQPLYCGARGFLGYTYSFPAGGAAGSKGWKESAGELPVMLNGAVRAVAVTGGRVYAGGGFREANGDRVDGIVSTAGAAGGIKPGSDGLPAGLTRLGYGVDGGVEALVPLPSPAAGAPGGGNSSSGQGIVVGGSFIAVRDATGQPAAAGGLAVWWLRDVISGAGEWGLLGGAELRGTVFALAAAGGMVCAGGRFNSVGSMDTSNVALFDGAAWGSMGGGVNGIVRALAMDADGDVYVAGSFTLAVNIGSDGVMAPLPVSNIVMWDGNGWEEVQDTACVTQTNGTATACGPDGEVLALALTGGRLFAAGRFSTVGGVSAPSVAVYWSGLWSPLGGGVDGIVYSLIATNLYGPVPAGTGVECVYVGGLFRLAYNDPAQTDSVDTAGLARWCIGDGEIASLTGLSDAASGGMLSSNWQRVDTPGPLVRAMAVFTTN